MSVLWPFTRGRLVDSESGVETHPPVKGWRFHCPGCSCDHYFTEDRWEFDGNWESPSFLPSLLCKGPGSDVCHLFVKGGMIEYLGDCTHPLAGQTIPMLTDEEWLHLEGDGGAKP